MRESLEAAHRGVGWLADILHLQAFVSIFNFWRLTWLELTCALKSLAQAIGIDELPMWPSWTSLVVLAQLAFMHLILVLYLLRRQEHEETQSRRRPRLSSLDLEQPAGSQEEKKQISRVSSAHSPAAHKQARRGELEELSERI